MPRDPQIDKIVTESKAVITRWQPDFGDLIHISLPPGTEPDKAKDSVKYLQEWWRSQSGYFKGAKLLVSLPGYELGVKSEEAMKKLGYVPEAEAQLI